ncbi:hypothetical protein E1B28_000958 [Marasmius oreades]|uniref:Uncharacterized protein n=1 Tax=Marasmius oreades TaxID=181124 RepID=A0A9P7V2F3_9AGAR|nr:uncharacterized protein E1B28_000958 [Marasmius oreades]KAG7099083.1 hypothetical protein E1B28_000958 [Marasmius oreades]
MNSGLITSSELTVTSTSVLRPVLSSSSLDRPSSLSSLSAISHSSTVAFSNLSSANTFSSAFSPSLSPSSGKELSSTSDPPVVKTPNLPELPSSTSLSESLGTTMSSTPHTTEKDDSQADTPTTSFHNSSTSVSESSKKTASETSSTVAPRPTQSSESHTITSNTTRSSTNLSFTNSFTTSTTTSVIFAKGTEPSTTVVSTITESPESTFKSAVGVVVTQSDGHTTLSFPPVVTVLSTSLLSNGSYVTFTHAVANPTGADQANGGTTSKGFLQNHGAVAGVFLAVGVILASLAGCIFILVRRQRRRKSQSSTHEDIQSLPQTPRYTDDPFEDHPQMAVVDGGNRVSMRSPDRLQLDDGGPLIPLTPTRQTPPVLVAPPVQRKQPPVDNGPFSDSNALSPIKQRIAVVVDDNPNRPRSPLQVSRQSTPSLYPPTDNDEYEDIDLDGSIPPAQARPLTDSSTNTSRPTSAEIQSVPFTAPPRPPRSILRVPSKVYEPNTPPPSESNHSSSDSPTTPVSERAFQPERQLRQVRSTSKTFGEDVLTRPTLLNVRPRSKGQ